MENEKFYVVNDNLTVATNMPLSALKKVFFRELKIKIITIKEINFFNYLKRINNSKSKPLIRYYN